MTDTFPSVRRPRRRATWWLASAALAAGLVSGYLVLAGGDNPAPSLTVTPDRARSAVASQGWRPVWADEFDGRTLDPAKWAPLDHSTFGDSNSELACLMDRPENVQVSGGVLTLRARRESPALACGSHDGRFPGGRSFSSAMVTTQGRASWTYGLFEMRARLPTQGMSGQAAGLWPAFWMRPDSGGTGELDIMEAVGAREGEDETNKVFQTIHYDYAGTHPATPYTTALPSTPTSQGFHTYAVTWQKGSIRWYIDDKLTYARTSATTSWLDSAFTKPFYLRLNLAVGGHWPGAPNSATAFPADYEIDYVRVYQR